MDLSFLIYERKDIGVSSVAQRFRDLALCSHGVGHCCSSDFIPGLGISICQGCSHLKKKKKRKRKGLNEMSFCIPSK